MDDRQLGWVQRARTVSNRTSTVGPLAHDLVRALGRGGPAWRQKLIGLLYEEVGLDLLDHAEPVSIRRGVLTFQVRESVVAYDLRLRWEQRLLQLIAARLPQAGVHTIRFAVK